VLAHIFQACNQIVKIARLTGCTKSVGKRSLYSILSLTLSQWRDLRMGVICEDLGAFTTARTRESVGAS